MNVLLLSTYELGHQPVHLASPAARLTASGLDVTCIDLSVDELDEETLHRADAVAFSVPMHTAMRLAVAAATQIKARRPDLPIAFYGLYADVGRDRHLGTIADAIFCGEYEDALDGWAKGHRPSNQVSIELGKTKFSVPRRDILPTLDSYARLEYEGEALLAGAVEASHGCRHRCRHCPIPAVYDGRLRVVGAETVVADIDQVVQAGARHITFTDADFLNAPAYSLDVLRQAHSRHPDVTFDVTVKVEHILAHENLWAEMSDLGVLFVVSAFESVDDETLRVLDKGHTREDMAQAARILGDAGIFLRPTWLPFLPWTKPGDIAGIFDFLVEHDLIGATDPVQLSIRVLIPEGSLLVDHPRMAPYLTHFDDAALTWAWTFDSPETELLQKELDRIAASASDCKEDSITTLRAMRQAIADSASVKLPEIDEATRSVPRLSESWFCCAEPTTGQASAIEMMQIGLKPT